MNFLTNNLRDRYAKPFRRWFVFIGAMLFGVLVCDWLAACENFGGQAASLLVSQWPATLCNEVRPVSYDRKVPGGVHRQVT